MKPVPSLSPTRWRVRLDRAMRMPMGMPTAMASSMAVTPSRRETGTFSARISVTGTLVR